MASLYDTSKTARKVVIGFLALTAVILVIDVVTNVQDNCTLGQCPVNNSAVRYYMNADRKFGEIDKPIINGIKLDTSVQPSYSLESVFTILPDVAYVYKIDKPREKLDDIEFAKTVVTKLGFNPENSKIAGNVYTWSTAGDTKIISYDKENLVWTMATQYTSNIEAQKTKSLNPVIDNYQRSASSLINSLGFSATGITNGLIDAKYAKYNNGTFFSNDDPLQSDYVIINVYRDLPFADLKPKDQLPATTNSSLIPKAIDAYVYTQDPRVGEIHLVVSNKLSDYTKDVFELNFTNYQYSIDSTSTNSLLRGSYLIISPDEAWTKIQQGQGALVSLIPQDGNYFADTQATVSVRKFVADRSKTLLGYFEPKDWTGYVYPIYVFQGRAELSDGRQANFTYYIEAIKRLD